MDSLHWQTGQCTLPLTELIENNVEILVKTLSPRIKFKNEIVELFKSKPRLKRCNLISTGLGVITVRDWDKFK